MSHNKPQIKDEYKVSVEVEGVKTQWDIELFFRERNANRGDALKELKDFIISSLASYYFINVQKNPVLVERIFVAAYECYKVKVIELSAISKLNLSGNFPFIMNHQFKVVQALLLDLIEYIYQGTQRASEVTYVRDAFLTKTGTTDNRTPSEREP